MLSLNVEDEVTEHYHNNINRRSSSNNRKKSSLNFQSQLELVNIAKDIGNEMASDQNNSRGSGRYSPHPSEVFLSHHCKLSVQTNDHRFDDSLGCCLPPPSPAPNSDRFIVSSSCNNTTSMIGDSISLNENGHSNSSQISSTYLNNHYESGKSQIPAILNSQNHRILTNCLSSATSTSSLSSKSGCSSGSCLTNSSTIVSNSMGHVPKYSSNSTSGSSMLRSSSPSGTRIRTSERFREYSLTKSQTDNSNSSSRFVPNSQFFTQNTQIVSNDTYNFNIASTVHTPIKRYIPTPPPQNEIPSASIDRSLSIANKSNNITNTNSVIQVGSTIHNANSIPYRLRIKCCTNDLSIQHQQQNTLSSNATIVQTSTSNYIVDNHINQQSDYSSSPRSRNYKIANTLNSANNYENPHMILYDQQQISFTNALKSNNSSTGLCYSSLTSNTEPEQTNLELNSANDVRREPNFFLSEHICQSSSIACMSTTVTASIANNANISSQDLNASIKLSSNNSENANSVATCIHCNTVRRTTGVHQTTQTGPISPIPVSIPVQLSTSSKITSNNVTAYEQNSTSISMNSKNESYIGNSIDLQDSTAQEQISHDDHQQQYSTKCNSFSQLNSMLQLTGNSNRQIMPQQQQRYSRKKRLGQYLRKEMANFFGVEISTEAEEKLLWHGRQRRLALRRFGALKSDSEINAEISHNTCNSETNNSGVNGYNNCQTSERPDVLPQDRDLYENNGLGARHSQFYLHPEFRMIDSIERKASVVTMIITAFMYVITYFNKLHKKNTSQWSRSFAPKHISCSESPADIFDGLNIIQDEEVFFDSPSTDQNGLTSNSTNNIQGQLSNNGTGTSPISGTSSGIIRNNINACSGVKTYDNLRQSYLSERINGWRTTAISGTENPQLGNQNKQASQSIQSQQQLNFRSNRISAHLLDGVLENSRRPLKHCVKLFEINDLDDRVDNRPFFTYWINTVQILIVFLSILCYGIGPIGFGVEQKTGQVLVTSLSLQTVQHVEQRNIWIGPRNNDLVHMGAKFATCMRRDIKIINVLLRTRRQERETACCIRNDDSGCVQSSQADCSVRGLFPTKSISTWKKWSPGESGPGGRISGSVCGLDPKYCDAPASIAPYEWPDDITKWPICRKTTFSQRFRYKDHTAEHMVCEVIGHPCCTGVFGECRITTREFCDFVHGYFHEEASLCSQISCLQNVCGMFPFFTIDFPDQLYRLFTSLCLHAGFLHLVITVIFQHIFLADLERLIGSIRTSFLYIGSGIAGNLTTALLIPYKAEVGPLASLSGVTASLLVLLILKHWKQLRKPHMALLKLIIIGAFLFGLGTLPWQINFAGLIAGILCGIFLTIALVPFISVTKYSRKSKINFIWTCFAMNFLIYSVMLAIFYLFPMELTDLSFGEVFINNFDENIAHNNVEITEVLSSKTNSESYKNFAHYLHHQSGDSFSKSKIKENSSKHLVHFLQPKTEQHQEPSIFYYRSYHINHFTNNSNSYGKVLSYDFSKDGYKHFNVENEEKVINRSNITKISDSFSKTVTNTKSKKISDVKVFKMIKNQTSFSLPYHLFALNFSSNT